MITQVPLQFVYEVEMLKQGVVIDRFRQGNLVPQQGVNHIAGLLRGDGTSPVSNWYLGIFEGDFQPSADTSSNDLQSPVQESLAYEEGERPLWEHAYDGTSSIDNLTNRAEFTINAEKTLYGAFIVSQATKGSEGGVLLSIARFNSPREVDDGVTFRVGAGILLVPTGAA